MTHLNWNQIFRFWSHIWCLAFWTCFLVFKAVSRERTDDSPPAPMTPLGHAHHLLLAGQEERTKRQIDVVTVWPWCSSQIPGGPGLQWPKPRSQTLIPRKTNLHPFPGGYGCGGKGKAVWTTRAWFITLSIFFLLNAVGEAGSMHRASLSQGN